MEAEPARPRALYLDVVTAAFVAVLLISNVAALKVIQLGGLIFDGGALIFPFSYIFGDVLTEVYGYRRSRRVIWIGFFWLVIYNLVLAATLAAPAEPHWNAEVGQQALERAFGHSWRLAAAGLLGYVWGEFINAYVLARLKVITEGRHLWMRTIGSTVLGELVDTAIFCTVAFAGILPWAQLLNYTLVGYLYKTLVEVVMTPVTYLVVNTLKRVEGIDTYDRDISFNPFGW